MNAREFIQQKREKIADEIAVAEARLGEMKAQDAVLYDLLRELPEAEAPAATSKPQIQDGEVKTGRDAESRNRRTLQICKYLDDGPKSFGDISSAVDFSEPTVAGILKLSPFFEKTGEARFSPWTLTQKGRLWLAQQSGKPSA